MDLLISEMEKLLVLGRDDCDIQDIIGDSAGKNIDDLLIEADKIISETLPYFQTNSNSNKVKASKDFNDTQMSSTNKTIPSKSHQNDTKKVFFNLKNNSQKIPESTSEISGKLATNKYALDEERKKKSICSLSLKNCATLEFKVPEVNFIKTQLQMNSTILDNHNRLQTMCNKHDKLVNSLETQGQINKSKLEEELNYYKLRNNELEKNLKLKEEEIHNWENRYQQLNQYCELFLKRNIEDTLNSYGYQLNELIDRNMTRESELRTIISNLLEEIEQSHLHYRVKLSEKNEQIRKYLDYIQRILNSVYEFRNKNVKR